MAEKGTTYCGFLKHWVKTPYSIKTGGMCPTPGNPMYETYQYAEEAFVAGCKFVIEHRKISKKVVAANSTSTNTERDVICSDSMCDYCAKVETCNGFEDAGDCFVGRKLTPIS